MSESTKASENDAENAEKEAPKGAPEKASAAAPVKPKRRRPVLRFFRNLGIAVLVLLAILVAKALTTKSRQIAAEAAADLAVDEMKAAEHLSRAVTFKTISNQDPAQTDTAAFFGLHAALQEMFPKAHQTLVREVVGERSLLYTWKGKDAAKPGVLLMAHMDVVPIEPGTEGDWEKPPFSGAIDGGFIWGRGTMDFKMGVVGLLEAVEALVTQGYTPARTVYFAFGHDEEVSGLKGARSIVELLTSRNVHLTYVLDEGMVVTEGILKGIERPVALVGLAEKGYISVELIVDGQGGHSSMPPRQTSVGILANAIVRVEGNPMPGRIEGPAKLLFETLAPEMPFGNRVILSNLWLLSGLAQKILSGSPPTDAILRTTTAPTMLEGSVKENVLPKRARAVVNFRILPGDSLQSVVEHVKQVIADDRVQVHPIEGFGQDPSPVSDVAGPGYKSVERTIRQVFPTAIVAPSLVLGATDSRHYQALADGVYRFSPQRMGPDDRPRYHGTNERVSVKNFAECVRFYAQLIRNTEAL
jgi:carboxypeptidase PM20D1